MRNNEKQDKYTKKTPARITNEISHTQTQKGGLNVEGIDKNKH